VEEQRSFTATYCLGDDSDQQNCHQYPFINGSQSPSAHSLVNKLAEDRPSNVGRQVEQHKGNPVRGRNMMMLFVSVLQADYKFAGSS